jgi:hypothetical protein
MFLKVCNPNDPTLNTLDLHNLSISNPRALVHEYVGSTNLVIKQLLIDELQKLPEDLKHTPRRNSIRFASLTSANDDLHLEHCKKVSSIQRHNNIGDQFKSWFDFNHTFIRTEEQIGSSLHRMDLSILPSTIHLAISMSQFAPPSLSIISHQPIALCSLLQGQRKDLPTCLFSPPSSHPVLFSRFSPSTPLVPRTNTFTISSLTSRTRPTFASQTPQLSTSTSAPQRSLSAPWF